MEQTAETNVEEFDETEVDAGLGAATAQETEPEESYEEAPEAAEGETEDEAGGEPRKAPKEPEKPEEKPFVKKGNDSNRDRRIAQKERWKREREEERARAYQKGLVDAVGGVNPYTNSKIEDAADIQEFLAMREIEKGGGDPIADFASFSKKKTREDSRKMQQEAQRREAQAQFESDVNEFAQSHPDIDVNKLLADEDFLYFADGKIGTRPIGEIFERYLKFKGSYEQKVQKEAQKIASKSLSSPGSLSGDAPERIVSDADIEKYLEDAMRGKLD